MLYVAKLVNQECQTYQSWIIQTEGMLALFNWFQKKDRWSSQLAELGNLSWTLSPLDCEMMVGELFAQYYVGYTGIMPILVSLP